MATKPLWILPEVTGGFDSSTANKGLAILDVLPNGEYKYSSISIAAPELATSLNEIIIWYLGLSTGNLYLRFAITRTSSTGITTNVGTYAVYAGGNALGNPASITIPSALVALFTTVTVGDTIGIAIERDGSHASDTYEADFKLHKARVTFNTSTAEGEAGRYCVQADLERRIGTETLAQLTNDTAGAATPDANVVNEMIAKADSIIDGYISQVYTTPLTGTVPKLVKDISIDLACFFCMQRKISEFAVPQDWTSLKKDRMQQLQDISDQSITLDTAPTPASEEADIVYPDKTFDFGDSDNQMSKF